MGGGREEGSTNQMGHIPVFRMCGIIGIDGSGKTRLF